MSHSPGDDSPDTPEEGSPESPPESDDAPQPKVISGLVSDVAETEVITGVQDLTKGGLTQELSLLESGRPTKGSLYQPMDPSKAPTQHLPMRHRPPEGILSSQTIALILFGGALVLASGVLIGYALRDIM